MKISKIVFKILRNIFLFLSILIIYACCRGAAGGAYFFPNSTPDYGVEGFFICIFPTVVFFPWIWIGDIVFSILAYVYDQKYKCRIQGKQIDKKMIMLSIGRVASIIPFAILILYLFVATAWGITSFNDTLYKGIIGFFLALCKSFLFWSFLLPFAGLWFFTSNEIKDIKKKEMEDMNKKEIEDTDNLI